MRTVIVFASVLLLGAALADVRHVSVPEWLWGTWAPSAELCRDDKSIIVMSEKSYMTSQANCTVQWLTETAAADGPIYSAHMRCSLPSTPEQETRRRARTSYSGQTCLHERRLNSSLACSICSTGGAAMRSVGYLFTD